MPLEGLNFKQDNKLVYKMLKAACVDTAAWAWLEKFDPTSNGRKAWMALVGHYDGYGELNKRTTRAKEELMKLHYKDKKAFSFERYITKLKELFRMLDKDTHEKYSEPRQVKFMLHGISSSDVGIISAKTTVFASPLMKSDFDEAVNFMSAYVSSRHFEAQSKYTHPRNGGQRRNVTAIASDGDRGGRGRGCRSSQRGGCNAGRGRGGCGRGSGGRMRSYINEVDVTDPNRNFRLPSGKSSEQCAVSYSECAKEMAVSVAVAAAEMKVVPRQIAPIAQPVACLPPKTATAMGTLRHR